MCVWRNELWNRSEQVTMDFVKSYYAKLIDWDLRMYDEDSGTPASATTTSIIEDLGQVRNDAVT